MKNIHIIRRTVATIANRLKKMGLTLSAAFKKAWELIKCKAISTRIAGVTNGSRQKALRRIATAYRPEQVSVSLERDKAIKQLYFMITQHLNVFKQQHYCTN